MQWVRGVSLKIKKKKLLQNLLIRGYTIKINRIATAVVFGITNLTKDVNKINESDVVIVGIN